MNARGEVLPDGVLTFVVVSPRSGETYQLDAERTPGGVRFTCSCPAADNGLHCRHRLGLLVGDMSDLVEGEAGVVTLASWVQGSVLAQAVSEVIEIERTMEQLKREAAARKKTIARLMWG